MTTAFSDTVGPTRSQGSASDTHDHEGWTVGGGLEYRIAENSLRIGAEYAYVELERQSHNKFVETGSLNTGRAVDDVAPSIHLFMARLSYRLPLW